MSGLTDIDMEALEAEVRRLANENPDAKRACRYVNEETNEPNCIVGCALYNLGMPIEVLRDRNRLNFHVWTHKQGLQNNLSATWVAYVQGEQDMGKTWSKAVEYADERYSYRSA
jgi:hypothetical protein